MAERPVDWYNPDRGISDCNEVFVILPPHELVTSQSAWHTCLARLQREPRLAIDLESNSLYAYHERVCLIQISIPGQDYIVDPIATIDLTGLGAIIRDPAVEKIFHAAEYDLILLKREYGWKLENLFDTMWAARILGYTRFGLANILKSLYDVKLDKRYQKANWCKRPLPPAQLTYAQMDTHYLLRLRDDLDAQLAEGGCTAESREIFADITNVQPANNEFDADSFWSISGVRQLNRRQQAVVKALAIYRDGVARSQNRPHFKIFDDRTIVELAEAAPRNLNELPAIHGMSARQIRRYGRKLLKVIRNGQNGPLPKKPKRKRRPSEAVSNRYERLRSWRKTRAQARGVESDVILGRHALWELAHANPKTKSELARIETIGPWRRDAYGDEILQVLRTT